MGWRQLRTLVSCDSICATCQRATSGGRTSESILGYLVSHQLDGGYQSQCTTGKEYMKGSGRTECGSAVRWDCALRCICETPKALVELRILGEYTGIIGVLLRDDWRRSSRSRSRGVDVVRRGRFLAVLVLFIIIRDGDAHTNTNGDEDDDNYSRAQDL